MNCKEKPKIDGPNVGKGTTAARVFALQQCEKAPSVDTLAGTIKIANHTAYALIDTGATHACLAESFVNECGLCSECCLIE